MSTLPEDISCQMETMFAQSITGNPYSYIQYCATYLMFNESFHSGYIPSEWKLGNVVPVFKKLLRLLSKIIDLFLLRH